MLWKKSSVSRRSDAVPVQRVAVPASPVIAAAPEKPAEVITAPEKPRPAAPRAAPSPAVVPRRSTIKGERSYAIRVSGGEIMTPPAMPTAGLAASRPVAAPEPLLPRLDHVGVPEAPAAPAISTAAPEPATAAPEAVLEKPQKAGNRLVRALGRINPFHKGAVNAK